jgi:hypothetical protein
VTMQCLALDGEAVLCRMEADQGRIQVLVS